MSGAAKVLPPGATPFERRVAREVPRVVHSPVERDTESNPAVAGYGSSIFGDFPGGSVGFGLGEPFAVVKTLLATGAIAATILLLGVVVRLPRRPAVHVADVASTPRLAFDAALAKLERALRRLRETARESKRRPTKYFAAKRALAGG